MTQSARTKIALVTGAGRGIGRCLAYTLARQGYGVMLADQDRGAVEEAAAGLPAQADAAWTVTDVSVETHVSSLLQQVKERWGRLDLLVNNAALADPGNTPLSSLPLGEWEQRLAVNLTGAMLCSKHATALLRASQGSIVNIASTRALQSEPDCEAYGASKAGLLGLTHAMAASLGPDIRVNAVSPGWIDTRAWRASGDREPEPLTAGDHAQHPAGRVGRPGDVAEAVLYLAASGFVTGSNLIVDGGMTRKMIYEE